MRKQQQKELRRLEEALLEIEDTQEAYPAGSDEWELDWEESDDSEYYDVYNTDDVDVDLDEYSEDVHRGKSGRGVSIIVTMLLMVVLSACILMLLRFLGVL